MAVDDTVIKWMESKQYLPPILRDFHDQKNFFKFLSLRIEQNRDAYAARGKDTYQFEGFNWAKFHILTIDYFLWFMAMNGYTLQKSRKRLPYLDYEETIKASREEWLKDCMEKNPAFYAQTPSEEAQTLSEKEP